MRPLFCCRLSVAGVGFSGSLSVGVAGSLLTQGVLQARYRSDLNLRNCHPERSGVRAAKGTESKDLRFDGSGTTPEFNRNTEQVLTGN
jgi:hypothetical protein